jgi:hypothetical protein
MRNGSMPCRPTARDGARGVVGVQRGEHLGGRWRAAFTAMSAVSLSRISPRSSRCPGPDEESNAGIRETQPISAFTADLIHTGSWYSIRILDSDDVVFGRIQFLKHRIQRGRFAGASRTGDEGSSRAAHPPPCGKTPTV